MKASIIINLLQEFSKEFMSPVEQGWHMWRRDRQTNRQMNGQAGGVKVITMSGCLHRWHKMET